MLQQEVIAQLHGAAGPQGQDQAPVTLIRGQQPAHHQPRKVEIQGSQYDFHKMCAVLCHHRVEKSTS